MFMGEFNHTIDNKGRLIIPAKFRSQLGERFVITRGMDQCLSGYSMAEWDKLKQQLEKLPMTKKNVRQFVRLIYSAAIECEFDRQGRVNLSKTLIDYAKISKKCMIVGVSSHFEIWDETAWQEYSEQAAEDFTDVAEDIDFDF
ncbi:division/cell wall cluster transcriptional repressor MraZ [Limosilactobacillus caecicola]|uniref:division/cell wall cluster transcriptional repressor MraZ n=1 Tax=Limosilactobacillus caecicola TaxID=2941332 RepID=UPI00203EF595|nr:division/cell wall cluster transcriptional repressor MraZ [Limosilactobacillus caecicola]